MVGKYSFRYLTDSKNWLTDSCRFFAHGISKYDVFIEIAAVNSSAILTYPRVVRHASFERHFSKAFLLKYSRHLPSYLSSSKQQTPAVTTILRQISRSATLYQQTVSGNSWSLTVSRHLILKSPKQAKTTRRAGRISPYTATSTTLDRTLAQLWVKRSSG